MHKTHSIGLIILILSLFTFGSCKRFFPRPDPIPCFTTTGELATLKPVQFNNCSQKGSTYEWHFSDGYNYTEENPVHYFKVHGKAKVTLIVTNESNSKSTITKELEIKQTPPGKFIINSIVLKKWPKYDYGNPWDPNSDPDIYPKIIANNNVLFNTGLYIDNCNMDNAFNIFYTDHGFPTAEFDFNQNYTIEWYDYDATSKDELMGKGVFRPNLALPSGFSEQTLKNGDFEFIVQFSWVY